MLGLAEHHTLWLTINLQYPISKQGSVCPAYSRKDKYSASFKHFIQIHKLLDYI